MEVEADWLAQYEHVQRAALASVKAAAPASAYYLDLDKSPGEYVTTGVDIVPRGHGLFPIHLVADDAGLTLYVADYPAIEDTTWQNARDFTELAVKIITAIMRGEGKVVNLKLGKHVVARKVFVRLGDEDVLIGQSFIAPSFLPFLRWEEQQLTPWK